MSEHGSTETKLHSPAVNEFGSNTDFDIAVGADYALYPGSPNQLPVEAVQSTYDEVRQAIDAVADTREAYEKTPGATETKFHSVIQPTVDAINNRDGIDNLAYWMVGSMELRRQMSAGPAEDHNVEEYRELVRDQQATRDIVKQLPKNSRIFYRRLRKHYQRNLDLENEFSLEGESHRPGVGDPEPAYEPDLLKLANEPGIPVVQSRFKETLGRSKDVIDRSKELLANKRVRRVLGTIAVAGAGYAIVKGIITPEQVAPHAHHAQDAAFAHHANSGRAHNTKPEGYEPTGSGYYGEDKVSKSEVAAEYILAVGGLRAYVKHKVNVRREAIEHREHAEHELAHKRAEHLAIKSMVNPDSPRAASLVDAMKHPFLLEEIRRHGHGATGSQHAGDVLTRYAHLIGGTAEDITRHFHDLGIDMDSTVFEDVATRGGGTTVAITNRNPAEVAGIVGHLTQGSLRLSDLPPTKAFLGDKDIRSGIEQLYGYDIDDNTRVAGLEDLMQWAPENPYVGSSRHTTQQYASQMKNIVHKIFDKLHDNLPNDRARKLVLEALRMQDSVYLYEYTEEGDGNEEPQQKSRYVFKKQGNIHAHIPSNYSLPARPKAA
jgi:hypothetical protein